jgi:hypothetical protein
MKADKDATSTWDRLPDDVTDALSSVLDSGDIPPRALVLYARWWQLETWLRTLTYVGLRSRDGLDWGSNLDPQAESPRQKDKQHEYMASPDWDDPLAYLDASRLFQRHCCIKAKGVLAVPQSGDAGPSDTLENRSKPGI